MKKLGTIYHKKGGDFNSPKVIENVKSKAEQEIDSMKSQAYDIWNRINQSKDFINSISWPNKNSFHSQNHL